jgi:gliding motility-associated-like protein
VPSDPTASVSVNGTLITPGSSSAPIPLTVGANSIVTDVTAQNGATKIYTIKITGTPSTNASLADLYLHCGAAGRNLMPYFYKYSLKYATTVGYDTTTVNLRATTLDNTAKISINGVPVASGVVSGNVPLKVGPNTINTVVTAQDGVTTKTYTMFITRRLSTDALLNSISISPATAKTLVTGPAYLNYTASVPNSVASVTITAVPQDSTATLKVNGIAVNPGVASAPIPLSVGQNTITTLITSEDGTVTNSCVITITRAPSSDALLTSLTINPVTGKTTVSGPGFANYTATVANSVTSVTVTPITQDTTATVTVNGVPVLSGAASAAIPLIVGQNTITTTVTAQDGVTTDAYIITITRSPSTNALISSIAVSPYIPKTVVSGPGYLNYSATAPYADNAVMITTITQDATATIKVNGIPVASGVASAPVPLIVGQNTITTVVTAQDGVTAKSYIFTITRSPASTNALLSAISITPATAKTLVTGPGNVNYAASVVYAVASVTITPTAADATATIKVNGAVVKSATASASIPLVVGKNTITTIVTAQDGLTTKSYIITITRAGRTAGNSIPDAVNVERPLFDEDAVVVHQGVSPNGDGINDFLVIEGIFNFPDNKLIIMNKNGTIVFESKGYDNTTRVFDGHSNKTGAMQTPGTYFYSLDYSAKGIIKHKTGFIVLKY